MSALSRLLRRFRTSEPSLAISLPAEADRGSLRMLLAEGRDQTLHAVQGGGWTAFESPLPEVIFRCTQRWPGLFVDAGANTGYYSLLALAARRENHIVAFEPDARVLPLLQGNLRINRFEGRAEVRTEALSDRQGEADLYLPVDDHGLVETSSSLEREFRATHDGAVTVPVTTLDAALLHRPPPAVLKIDVEGHEAAVLSGAGAMIEEHRPVVALELLSGADFAGVNALLSHSRYRAVRLRTDAAVREEVVEYDPLAWNHMLVPEEKWSEFEALLRACRLTS